MKLQTFVAVGILLAAFSVGLLTTPKRLSATPPVQHVIVIVQENRTVDNLFNGLPGADTVTSGVDHLGVTHTLATIHLSTRCGPDHSHEAAIEDYNGGNGNGWLLAPFGCTRDEPNPVPDQFDKVDAADTAIYRAFATSYGFADEVFQENLGPSFAAHVYLTAGQAGGYGADGLAFVNNGGHSGGGSGIQTGGGTFCGAPNGDVVNQIDMKTKLPGVVGNDVFPCKDIATVFNLADAAGYTWKYYCSTGQFNGYWGAGVGAIQSLWFSGEHATTPETRVLDDIANHTLPNIAYVTPLNKNSDHPHHEFEDSTDGPKWVASIANAVGNDPFYWNNTTIFVIWDDWGGWYDHVVPPRAPNPNWSSGVPNPNEYGFRVPLLVISPWVTTAGEVDHTARSGAAIIHYIESTFSLGSLGTLDSLTDDMSSMFNYSRSPLPYLPQATGTFSPYSPDSTHLDAFDLDG